MTKKNYISQYISLNDAIKNGNYWDFMHLITELEGHDFERNNHDMIHDEAHDDFYDYSHEQLTPDSPSVAIANSYSNAFAVGIENLNAISGDCGDDVIFGTANADAFSEAIATSKAKSLGDYVSAITASSSSIAQSIAVATGIDNLGKITTGRGNDIIVGIANANAFSEATATSKAKSLEDDMAAAIANSESIAETVAAAAGINNAGKIATGKGNDLVVGIASTSTSSLVTATAKAIFESNGSDMVSDLAEISNMTMAESTSIGVANSQTTTLGINNSGKISTGRGADLVLGIANGESSSNSVTTSEAKVVSETLATVVAEAEAISLVQADAVGIANQGKIVTGRGNDTIVGIALNSPVASAEADAFASGMADEASSETTTTTIADTSAAQAIGIDNTSGSIFAGRGHDLVVGYGSTIGILGGEINTGKGDDRIIGYGGSVGIKDSKIHAGSGNDYFQAAKIDIDSFTGDFSFSEDQTGAIENAEVHGNHGHDTFEVSGFAGDVSIDGGRDFDVLKLWGNIDHYQITLGSDRQTLTIEDSGSILTAKNVEEFYFESDRYSIGDFA